MSNRNRNLLIIVLTVISVIIINLPISTNFWMLITQKNFEIPKESSFWTFRADKVNNVRDDWWFYVMTAKASSLKIKMVLRVFQKKRVSTVPVLWKQTLKPGVSNCLGKQLFWYLGAAFQASLLKSSSGEPWQLKAVANKEVFSAVTESYVSRQPASWFLASRYPEKAKNQAQYSQ